MTSSKNVPKITYIKNILTAISHVIFTNFLFVGTLVISVYAGCPDITATLTPDLKCPSEQGMYIWLC